jgi:hypothetical protein
MGIGYSRVGSPADLREMNISTPAYSPSRSVVPARDETATPESVFHSVLMLERRRAERSRNAFVLMLLDANQENGAAAGILRQAFDVALATKRETDLVGWYKENAILGVIFTEVNLEGDPPIAETLRAKIASALMKHLGQEKAAKIAISLHVFPETEDKHHSGWVEGSKLYPDLNRKGSRKRPPLGIEE